jgi:peptide/nickel transport system substrate-binding protein
MDSIRKPGRWLLLMTVLAMLAAACGDGGGGDTDDTGGASEPPATSEETESEVGEAAEGGTVVYGAEQEPAVMMPITTSGNLFATTVITTPILEGAYEVLPDFTYSPQLLADEAEVSEDGTEITYTIKEEATWSDGEPIGADDLIFTYETFVNKKFDVSSREGYNLITKAEKVDEKSATFTFKEPFAPYKSLFAPVLPKHELEGENIDKVWNNEITVASGPFEFDSWNKGTDATIKRNENYWGEMAALDEIIFRFILDSNTMVQSLKGGEIDMMYPQPQVDLVEQVDALDGVETDTQAGTVWEHLDFNFTVKALDKPYVRQAIAQGIDREAIVERIVKPINPEAVPLQNLIYMNNQAEYEPHFDRYSYDPAAAEKLLTDNGCTKDGAVYECEGEKLSFKYATVAGNEARELQQQVIQAQLKEIGIEIKPANEEADALFGTTLPGGKKGAWELINFAWVGAPDPFGGNSIFICEGDLNEQSYCNEDVTDLINQTNSQVDPEERAATYNEADALMAEDLPILPLYQKPTFFAWKDTIQGPADNPTSQGPTWNAGDWTLTE